ncbi:hypothetical protein [Halorientalis halophila]|uniref:hypothetical protein n=1 Tax=Halorientalis halophila TaxID=3108499 RepID=UPI00300A6AA9
MAAGSGVVLLVLAFALVAPVALWLLIESETDDTDVMDRRRAEDSARADSRATAERRVDDRRESTGRANGDRSEP